MLLLDVTYLFLELLAYRNIQVILSRDLVKLSPIVLLLNFQLSTERSLLLFRAGHGPFLWHRLRNGRSLSGHDWLSLCYPVFLFYQPQADGPLIVASESVRILAIDFDEAVFVVLWAIFGRGGAPPLKHGASFAP
jgi:hypothetical protein